MNQAATQKPHARTIRRQEPFSATQEQAALAPQMPTDPIAVPVKEAHEWRSISEQLAQHRLFKRNEHIPLLKVAFPANRRMWNVDKFFPYASGGPLAVDETSHLKYEVDESRQKQEILKQAGIRMVYLTPSTNYTQACEQLAGLGI